MEFWTENQGQSPLYSDFGTVPGRNCASNYYDRHQATEYPLYYSAQQDQVREPSYWTAQSRTGRAKHEYTNWMDQDLTSSASAQFPFILNRHPQDMGEYQLHEARDREWTAAQRATREYERGYLQAGKQRRWEPCCPVRYNQEVLTKRSENSYRELEAWAARYSHSLPRRKRIEAELRGASQGLQETSAPERAYIRSGTDPRLAALQQALQSASTKERGLWDRGGRQQGPTHGLSQTLTRDVSHMLDTKEKASNQRRILSQPPGYIAPPPYNSPHKSSPALIKSDTSPREVKGQSSWLQLRLEKQDLSVDSHSPRKVEKENLTQPDATQEIFLELEGLKLRRQEKDAVQATCPNNTQKTNIQQEGMMPSQQLQVLQAFQNKKTKEGSSTKVIEGRKFRLNKKTGGMTIFCLVSRIASTTEIQSLPLSHSNPNTNNTESVAHSKDLMDHSVNKLADEVDFTLSMPALQEQTKTSASTSLQAKQKKRQMSAEEMLKDCSETSVTGVPLQAVQPVMVKYPLWREPGSTSRAETEALSACLEVNSEKGESEVQQNQKDFLKVQPIDIEVRRLDITKATEPEDSKGLLVIDTTCVLVKMELIPSPKKEHVHFLHTKPQTEDSKLDETSTLSPEVDQSNSQLNQDWPSDPDTNPSPCHEGLGTEVESDLGEKKEPEKETEISFSCMPKSSVPDKETMAERAERILGIPLQDCMTDLPLGDASSFLDLFVESQKVDPPQIEGEDNCDAAHKIQEEKKDEEQLQNLTEVNQTEDAVYLHEDYDAKDEGHEGSQEFPGIQEQVSDMPDEVDDISLKTDSNCSFEQEMTEGPLLEINKNGTTEQSQDKNQPPTSPHNELIPLNSMENEAPPSETAHQSHNQSQLSLPLLTNVFTQTSAAHTDQSPNLPPLDPADETAEALSTGAEDQPDWGESSQSIADEISSALRKDMTEEWVSLTTEQHEDSSSVKDSNVGDEQHTEQADKDPKDNTMEDAREINISQHINECVPGEEIACVKEMSFTEEQLPNEATEDPPGLISEETFIIPTESASDQIEIECVHTEDVVCAKDSSTTNGQPEEVYNDHTDALQNTPDSLMETRNVQDTDPHYEAPNSSELYSSSNASHDDLVPLLEISSASPSAQNPDVDADAAGGIPETLPSPVLLESCNEDLQLPSPSDVPPVLHPSSSPQEGRKRSSPDVTLTEPLRYPTSLRDAVSRIRKHTAPDSENEEEEVSELWELESIGEEQGCQDEEESLKMRELVFEEAGQQTYTDESDEEVKKNLEQHGNREEDTLSCSSTSSHSSDDTVIEADDDECEESKPDDGAEKQESEREQSFSCAVTDKTRAKDEEDEGLRDESE